MKRAQAIRKSRETVRRDDSGRCKGWSDCSRSKAGRQAGRRVGERAGERAAADVEEDWGAARAWGVGAVVVGGVGVVAGEQSAYRVGVDGGACM